MTKKKVKDLNSALHYLSKCNGVVIWDTIWITIAVFFIATFIAFFDRCKKPVVLTIIIIALLLLALGHFIGTYRWRRKNYDNLIYKYTSKFYEISNESLYLEDIDKSIQEEMVLVTNLMIITRRYIIGRQSDLNFSPVVIPVNAIKSYGFFMLKTISKTRAHDIGVLRCDLYNGKAVDYVIGRGSGSFPILNQIKQCGINVQNISVKR